MTSMAHSRPWSIRSWAAAAGDSPPPNSACPKSSSTPTLSTPMALMPRAVFAAESQNIFWRGSRGLYSMTIFTSGLACASSRIPPETASSHCWACETWNG